MINKTIFITAISLGCALSSFAGNDSYRNLATRQCPILDTPHQTLSSLELIYTGPAESSAAGWGDVSAAELNAWVRVLYLENSIGSDFEIKLQLNTITFFLEEGEGDSYPLFTGGAHLQWNQRYEGGFGLQVEADPGISSTIADTSAARFIIPCGVTLIKAFNRDTAFFAGASVYPGFEKQAEPKVGFHWSRMDSIIIEIGYPESKLLLKPSSWLSFTAGGRIRNWPEYSLDDDDSRETLYYDETMVYAGINLAISEYTEVYLRVGSMLDRTASFEADSPDVELDEAMFFGFGFGGRL